ncbi:hypothetical protein [Pseudomonas veronii]|uniref:hypothetical protein n=1 Tax=Pseudomonas veronii TaxID=76761 RepID=UPI0015A26D36|nr:hypothetical protein [Pseudomonas veronii]NWC59477.1 hypothetical protein [Pseudomonas veronii]
MSQPKNDPITLELPAYVVDMLAEWARLDGSIVRPSVVPGDKMQQHKQSAILSHGIVLGVLNALPNFSAEGDFADALNERDEAYADYHAAQAAKDN